MPRYWINTGAIEVDESGSLCREIIKADQEYFEEVNKKYPSEYSESGTLVIKTLNKDYADQVVIELEDLREKCNRKYEVKAYNGFHEVHISEQPICKNCGKWLAFNWRSCPDCGSTEFE